MENVCDKIDAYQEGELTKEERAAFVRHLESCPSCREELEWIRSLDQMFLETPVRKPPRGIERGVLSALGFRRRPVWANALGWTTASAVAAWLVALPLVIREAGPRSIAPFARGLADIPSFFSALLHTFHVLVDLLRPAGATMEALAKVAAHTHLPLITLAILTVGFVSGLGILYNLRGVRYASAHA